MGKEGRFSLASIELILDIMRFICKDILPPIQNTYHAFICVVFPDEI